MKTSRASRSSSLVARRGCGDNLTHPGRDGVDGAARRGARLSACRTSTANRRDRAAGGASTSPVTYLVSPAGERAPVTSSGKMTAQGGLAWDFSPDFANDQAADARGLGGRLVSGTRPRSPRASSSSPLDAADHARRRLRGRRRRPSPARRGVDGREPARGQDAPRLRHSRSRLPLPARARAPRGSRSGDVDERHVGGLPYAGNDTYEVTRRRHRAARAAMTHLHPGAPGAHQGDASSPRSVRATRSTGRSASSSSASARSPAPPSRDRRDEARFHHRRRAASPRSLRSMRP